MADASGQYWITFNGEIYNYQELRRELQARGHYFRTASDTEVILAAYRTWGTDCLSHLNGMFAFGLYDSATRRVFLARDRAGEKPLFYYHTPGKLVFASELKALMADPAFPRQLDLEGLDYYRAYGYVPGEKCILMGVCTLLQGHAATYDLETDTLRVCRYWQLVKHGRNRTERPGDPILDRRMPDKEPLTREVVAWEKQRNTAGCRIDWQFTTQEARIKLKRLYPSIELG
jgi:asparagine synthase (glutamine-hydrolysing)